MTGANFLAYVKQSFKRSDKDTEIYTATADTIMDMRARMLSDENAYVSSVPSGSLAVGDYRLAVPSDFGHIIGSISVKDGASDTVYDPLTRISKEEYDEKYALNLSTDVGKRNTGVPQHFCYFGKELYIAPAVDKTTYIFSINYTIEDAPTYTGATTLIPFTDQFREVVRAGVLYRMYIELGFANESGIWLAAYEMGVQKIIDNDLVNVGTSTTQMKYNGV